MEKTKNLKSLKKDELIELIEKLQQENELLKDESKLACKVEELKDDLEMLQVDYDRINEEFKELEQEFEAYENKFSSELAYELRNTIDDILNNVTRETLSRVKNDLQICYDKLDLVVGNSSIQVLPLPLIA